MRALTVKNPHAWAISQGISVDGCAHRQPLKPVENRSWSPNLIAEGDFFAIHAGAAKMKLDLRRWYMKTLKASGIVLPSSEDPEMPFSAIVALVRYSGSVTSLEALLERLGERALPFWIGPTGWILEDVVPLEKPIPVRGALSLWDVPSPAMDKIRAELIGRDLPGGLEEELFC